MLADKAKNTILEVEECHKLYTAPEATLLELLTRFEIGAALTLLNEPTTVECFNPYSEERLCLLLASAAGATGSGCSQFGIGFLVGAAPINGALQKVILGYLQTRVQGVYHYQRIDGSQAEYSTYFIFGLQLYQEQMANEMYSAMTNCLDCAHYRGEGDATGTPETVPGQLPARDPWHGHVRPNADDRHWKPTCSDHDRPYFELT